MLVGASVNSFAGTGHSELGGIMTAMCCARALMLTHAWGSAMPCLALMNLFKTTDFMRLSPCQPELPLFTLIICMVGGYGWGLKDEQLSLQRL